MYLLLVIFGAIVLLVTLLLYRLYKEDKENRALIATVTDLNRGNNAEHNMILQLLKSGIAPTDIYHDLLLVSNNGRTAQIDIVCITQIGVLVIEVKDYSGWLYGSVHQNQWTQVLNYGKEKYKFYNPILQNKTHIDAIKQCAPDIAALPYHSIIVFDGDCDLKTSLALPTDTAVLHKVHLADYIQQLLKHTTIIPATDYDKLRTMLKEAEANATQPDLIKLHKERVRHAATQY